jgi:hypothetical protein
VQVIDGRDVPILCLAELGEFLEIPSLVDLATDVRKVQARHSTIHSLTTMSASGSTCW